MKCCWFWFYLSSIQCRQRNSIHFKCIFAITTRTRCTHDFIEWMHIAHRQRHIESNRVKNRSCSIREIALRSMSTRWLAFLLFAALLLLQPTHRVHSIALVSVRVRSTCNVRRITVSIHRIKLASIEFYCISCLFAAVMQWPTGSSITDTAVAVDCN